MTNQAHSSKLPAKSSACYLVTGAAGFIASKVCELLLADGHTVVGVDNLNDYYDVRLKYYRLSRLAEMAGCPADEVAKIKNHAAAAETPNAKGPKAKQGTGAEEGKGDEGERYEGVRVRGGEGERYEGVRVRGDEDCSTQSSHPQTLAPSNPRLSIRSARFEFHTLDIEDLPALDAVFGAHSFAAVFNLAARAGVRASLENPAIYRSTNIVGEENVLTCQVKYGVKKHVLASSSSVYAGCPMPFTEDSVLGTMQSPYAETKRRAEEIAREYHEKHGLDVTVLRYFTVFGPAGRPDMAPYRFVHWVATGQPIKLYGDGNQSRDFTYVDDIARGTVLAARLLGGPSTVDGGRSAVDGGRWTVDGGRSAVDSSSGFSAGFEIINLGGGNRPMTINAMIQLIETELNKQALAQATDHELSELQVSGFRSQVSAYKAVIDRHPVNAADMADTQADITKAGQLLGWKPQVSPEEGFRKTVDWYLANRSWLEGVSV